MLETQESWWCASKNGRAEGSGSSGKAGNWCQSSSSQAEKGAHSPFLHILFYSSLQLIRWGPPHKVEQSALFKLHWFKCRISSGNTFTERPGIIFNQISGYCGPTKLTHKIYYHTNRSQNARGSFGGSHPGPQYIFILTACWKDNTLDVIGWIKYFINFSFVWLLEIF